MPSLLPFVDPEGLLEFSVVYTDRALNHMSRRFAGVVQDIIATLKHVYAAESVALIPGSGTFGMEAVARQFANRQKVLVIRNGMFSYRWSQIFDAGSYGGSVMVLQACQQGSGPQAPWAPPTAEEVSAMIHSERPGLVFAPHVETADGIMLTDDYLRAVGAAAREVGALFVLDCIASGAVWVDMQKLGIDILISAPQKSWSSTPCCAMVMFGERARKAIDGTQSSSFAADLKRWLDICEGYERGVPGYHATMPTDSLMRLRDAMLEAREYGLDRLRAAQIELGRRVRELLEARGFPSVAAEGWKAPGVVVSYTTDPNIQNGRRFAELGLQTAAGVPLKCGEGSDFRTFRIGLFGLDKWYDVDRTVDHLTAALDRISPGNA